MVTHRWFRIILLLPLLVVVPSTIVLAARTTQGADDPIQFTGRMVAKGGPFPGRRDSGYPGLAETTAMCQPVSAEVRNSPSQCLPPAS